MRVLEEEDCREFIKLSQQLGYELTEHMFKERYNKISQDDNHIVYVVESSKRIIGWVHVVAENLMISDLRANIFGIVVNKEHRGNGTGRMLMRAAEKWAHSKGCKGIIVKSGGTRKGAHKFYESIGYDNIKFQEIFYREL